MRIPNVEPNLQLNVYTAVIRKPKNDNHPFSLLSLKVMNYTLALCFFYCHNCFILQGFTINMRLKYRFWFSIFYKWHKVHQKDWKSNELSKMWSTIFVSLKLTEILYILTVLLIYWNLDKFPNISVNFRGKVMVDRILEIPRLAVFGIKCILQNNVYKIIPHRTKTI